VKELLSVVLVRNGQLLATLSAARCQYAAAILCCHSLAETVLVYTTAIVRLKCSFHCLIIIYLLLIRPFWDAKILIIFEIAKK